AVWHARRALTVHDLAMTPGANGRCARARPTALGARFTLHETGVWLLRRCFATEKFEIVTPTSRMPLGGGKTDRIRPRATSCSLSLVSMLVSIDRLRVDIWKLAHLIFTVTVRPRKSAFSHQVQT